MNKLLYITVGIFVFIGFLLFMAPASSVHRYFQDDLGQHIPDVNLTDISGSAWQGDGKLHFRQFPPVTLSWTLSPFRLITGAADMTARAAGKGLRADLSGTIETDGGEVSTLTASIDSDYLNQVTIPYGLDLSGDIQLEQAKLKFNRQWLSSADAQLHWTGGIVHIETPEKIHTVKLPRLDGVLSMDGQNLILNVTESGTEMMSITLKPDGWAVVDIAYSFADLADLPLLGTNSTLDRTQPAITLEEKIL